MRQHDTTTDRSVLVLSGGMLAACILLAWPAAVRADALTQTFSATTGVQYYSNPVFTPGNAQAVTVGTFAPQYTIGTTGGANNWNLNAGLNVQRSSDPGIMINRADPSLTAGWEHDWATGNFGLSAHYDQSSILFGNTATTPENVNYVHDGSRDTSSASAKWTEALSEYWQLETDASYNQISFTGLSAAGPVNAPVSLATLALSNYQDAIFGAKLARTLSDAVLAYGQISYTRLTMTAPQPDSSEVNSILGLHWQATTTVSLDAYAGESSIATDGSQAVYASSAMAPASSGAIGDATLAWQGQQASASLEASRTNKPSGFGGFMSTDLITAKAQDTFSERNSAGVEYDYLENLDLFISTSNRYIAWVTHKFTPSLNLQLMLQRLSMSFLSNPTEYNNIIGLNLYYTLADF